MVVVKQACELVLIFWKASSASTLLSVHHAYNDGHFFDLIILRMFPNVTELRICCDIL
jgi:hypothetical protein